MIKQFKNNSTGSARLSFLLVMLMLVMALASQYTMKARHWNHYYPEALVTSLSDLALQAIPAQIKSFSAGVFRITADEYMHIGPSKKTKQNFVAGSFAGNTEIMSLLELSVILEPTNMEMYAVMSQNLAFHLNRFHDAIELLHRGILANKRSPDLHKLYMAGAYCYGFIKKPSFSSHEEVKKNRAIAVNYLNAAISSYLKNEYRLTPTMADDFANLQNYYVLQSRFLSDIGKRELALEAWNKVTAERQKSYLGHFFTMVQQKETAMPEFPDDLLTPEYKSLFQVSTIRMPYGATAPYRFWLVDSTNLYYLTIYARGLGALSLLEKDCPQHQAALEASETSIDGINDPFPKLSDCGHDHSSENEHALHQQQTTGADQDQDRDHTHISLDHVCGPECEHERHHENGEECQHCASAKSWKQAGNSVMLQGILMLTVAVLIRKFF
ncbi:MAG: hypothetical protein KKB51_21385 [Candidatus Riflebacteria bacterium]|nr:hypothetical protein [Candidatus Riflebacteria bacterium]